MDNPVPSQFYPVTIYSDDGGELHLRLPHPAHPAHKISVEVLKIFGVVYDNEQLSAEVYPIYSEEMRANLGAFLIKHKHRASEFSGIGRLMKRLSVGKYFFVSMEPVNPEVRQRAMSELFRRNEPNLQQQDYLDATSLLNRLTVNYQMRVFSETPIFLGEPEKGLRRCLYCGLTQGQGAIFSKKAHAFSEFLGNKSVFQNEECDSCNQYFGLTIEPSLATLLNILLTTCGVHGKKGIPRTSNQKGHEIIRFPDKILFKTPDGETSFPGLPTPKQSIEFDLSEKIVPIRIYKALVKYFVSLCGNGYREELEDTIKWIRYDAPLSTLPLVAERFDVNHLTNKPTAVTYVRENQNPDVPRFIMELKVAGAAFVCIVPGAKGEVTDFSLGPNFEKFWSAMSHHENEPNWIFRDFSGEEEVTLRIKADLRAHKRNEKFE